MNLTYILEIVGTVAFAFVGAQIAIDLGLDFLGIYVAGLSTAVGGGMILSLIHICTLLRGQFDVPDPLQTR